MRVYGKKLSSESLFNSLDGMEFVDVPKIISNYKARLYMGRGIEFKHKSPKVVKLWDEIEKLNRFAELMFLVERQLSEIGSCVITISRNIEGLPLVNLSCPYFSSNVETSYGSSDFAVVVESIYVDNSLHLIRSAYDKEKVVRTMWDSNSGNAINMYDYVSKLPKEKQINYGIYDKNTNSYVLYHNFGFVPCEVLTNKPFRPFFPMNNAGLYYVSPFLTTINSRANGFDYTSVSDTALCGGLIIQLQNLYTQMNKLVILDKPRIAVEGLTQTAYNEMRANRDLAKQAYFNDLIFNVGSAKSVGTTTKMTIMSPTNSLDHYQNQIVATWVDIFKSCGLSYQTQSGTQKTAQESVSAFAGSVEELNYLREFHTKQWIRVIEKMLSISGVKDNNWSFQVKKNIVVDEASRLDSLIKELQAGTKTPIDIISTIDGVSYDNALTLYKEKQEWFKENDYPVQMKDGGKGVSGVRSAELPTSKEKGGRPVNEKE